LLKYFKCDIIQIPTKVNSVITGKVKSRLFVFAQQLTDNTTTIPSTATVGGEGQRQRQEESTSKKTATSDNNNNTLPLLPSWNEGDAKRKY
jgi:hypothetical protein